MKNIVVLCSGGFDSVLLIQYVRDLFPEAEIHSLFFNYGQNSLELERQCAERVSYRVSAELTEIQLPKFSWSKKGFYDSEFVSHESQYLEMRNLIFYSYALSFAEGVGAKDIYSAIIKTEENYADTELSFFKDFNRLSKRSLETLLNVPFLFCTKWDLASLVKKYGLRKSDFCSCDTPIDGKPCGKCTDCKLTDEILSLVYSNI
jgi:7-cyano-7-deazaguanine synthase